MRATSADLTSTPVAARQVWARLGILAAVLAGALALLVLAVAWLLPAGPLPWAVEYPLADLEVGVPAFYRPFDMGSGRAGELHGVWLVRTEDGDVVALWSRTAHPRDCNIRPWVARAGSFNETRTPRIPTAEGQPSLFRTPCLGSTFLLDGTRIFGPAPRGLDSFPARVEGDTIKIDLTRLVVGQCGGLVFGGCSTPEQPRTIRTRWPYPERNVR